MVKVYQNTCRHRGMILVEEKKKVGGVMRCPYHSWCYALTGELVTTPHVGGPGQNTHAEIHREELGLVEIRSHVWRDIIFVNVSGERPHSRIYAADAISRWAEFEGQPLVSGGEESSFRFDVACNWKLAVENYCESYHLPWVHPGLNSYSRLEDHYHIEEPGKFSGQGTLVYRPMITEDGRRFPDFKGLSDKWDAGAEYITLYPNVLLGVHRDHAFAIILEPMAKDRTVEHVVDLLCHRRGDRYRLGADAQAQRRDVVRRVRRGPVRRRGHAEGPQRHLFRRRQVQPGDGRADALLSPLGGLPS